MPNQGLPSCAAASARTRRRSPAWTFAACLIASVALAAGCTPVPQHDYDASAAVTQNHIDLYFSPGSSELQPAESHRLARFLEDHRASPDDAVQISVEAGIEPTLDDRRRQHIAQVVADLGLDSWTASAPPPARMGSAIAGRPIARNADRATVILARYHAHSPDCVPPPNRLIRFPVDASETTAFGCSTARNLATQVSRPRDLVLGREMGTTPADRAVLSIQDYRAGTDGHSPTDSTMPVGISTTQAP
ncbi:CpaD family pilus assembly lipoprotein [Fodinicurvata sp. EGI_FJ10296]|uniref:CpaD family pilus assembly lipoprotein n=1 Tax=Fodinicurvata sp. EGI_FJ10296 TaxID=3231908 RepID=UPI003452DF27